MIIHGLDTNKDLRTLLVDATGRPLVVVNDALPAGDNNIGNVDIVTMPVGHNIIDSLPAITGTVGVNSLPSIPAGSNNIGDVDVVTMPITQVKGSNSNHLLTFENCVLGNLDYTLAAGDNYVNLYTPATNKIARITHLDLLVENTCTSISFRDSAYGSPFTPVIAPTAYTWYVYDVDLWFNSNFGVYVYVLGATAGKKLYAHCNGYYFDVS